LTWGRRDRLPALYQLDNLVGFPGEVTIRPERIVPTAIRAEIKRQDMKVRETDGIAAVIFNACAFYIALWKVLLIARTLCDYALF